MCGPRDYKIRVGSGANDALFGPASIAMNTPAAGQHTLTISPDDINLVGVHTLYIRTTWTDYSRSDKRAFTLTITHPGCDCELLLWDNPSMATRTVPIVLANGNSQIVSLPLATVK